MIDFSFTARGHENVLALHETTFEFTMDSHLTPRGDCIVAVASEVGCAQLPNKIKKALKREDARLTIEIECAGVSDVVHARGNSKLSLSHPTDMVVRKSDFVCSRTLAVGSDKAACDLKRGLIENITEGNPVNIKLKVE